MLVEKLSAVFSKFWKNIQNTPIPKLYTAKIYIVNRVGTVKPKNKQKVL
jgi:hypothetical protein